jgi:hypothetical protein
MIVVTVPGVGVDPTRMGIPGAMIWLRRLFSSIDQRKLLKVAVASASVPLSSLGIAKDE